MTTPTPRPGDDGYSLYVSEPTPSFPLDGIRKQDKEIQIPTISLTPRRSHLDCTLKIFSILFAILVGCAITGGSTYALARDVQRSIETSRGAMNSRDYKHWMHIARTTVYDACYHGCRNCNNPNYAYDACARTAEVNVTGVICDGNVMWNWKDRYPAACLKAVGEICKKDMFRSARRDHLKKFAYIVLTVLADVVFGFLTYGIFWCWIGQYRKHRAVKARQRSAVWPRENGYGYDQPPPPPSTMWESGTEKTPTPSKTGVAPPLKASKKTTGRRSLSWGQLSIAALATLPGKTAAYPCTGYDDVANQYFVDANQSTFGVVSGWMSNCYKYRRRSGKHWPTHTRRNVAPLDYVNEILPSVVGCGFELVEAVEGDTNLRIANPLIEKEWRVMIRVNGYNLTSSTETDQSIQCLHDISKSK
ncbi:hypothetical protein V499_08630 [Pseudogymnoascus sp. VKM F-103]|nr:hypothetical protein V499_08630 [Pseudogymnoascus sp. VKM F-103]